jgi:hypothetical protein
MSIIPNYLVTGLFAIACSLAVLLWAAFFVNSKHGGWILLLLAITLTLVGGGLVTLLFGLIAGVAATRIHAPLAWWRAHLSPTARSILATLWPWTIGALLLWFPMEGAIAYISNQAMLHLAPIATATLPALLLLVLMTGFAHDLRHHANTVSV